MNIPDNAKLTDEEIRLLPIHGLAEHKIELYKALADVASEKAYKQAMERIFKEIEQMPVLSDKGIGEIYGLSNVKNWLPVTWEMPRRVAQAQKVDILRKLKEWGINDEREV